MPYKNRKDALERNRRYYLANREKALVKAKEYYEKNREAKLQYERESYKKDPSRKDAQSAVRRAKTRQAQPKWADVKEMRYIYKLAKERGLHVDHIVPLNSDIVCGLHTPDNLRCINPEWNMSKGNRHYPDQMNGC